MTYDNTNKGALWKNDKRDTDKHPNLTGSLNVEGVEYWVSAWTHKPESAEDRRPIVSFDIKSKDSQKAPRPTSQAEDDFDDSLPF